MRLAHDQIVENGSRFSDKIAISTSSEQIAYGDVVAQASELADRLVRCGIGRGATVAIPAIREPGVVIAMLATLLAGGAYVPIEPRDADRQVARLQKQLNIGATVRVTRGPAWDSSDKYSVEGHPPSVRAPSYRVSAQTWLDLAYVFLTSGSTGMPKAVAVEHRNLVHSTSARDAYERPNCDVTFLCTQALSFDASVYEIFWTLSRAGELVIATEDEILDPLALGELMYRRGVHYLNCSPSYYGVLLDTVPPKNLASIRHVTVGGEECRPALASAHFSTVPDAVLVNDYGPSECAVWSTRHKVERLESPIPIGTAIPGAAVYILKDLQTGTMETSGELYISGDGVGRGYVGDVRLTAERFLPDPFSSTPGRRMYRTGDIVDTSPRGEIVFVGRRDDEVKVRGFRIQLNLVARYLRNVTGVTDAVVLLLGRGEDAHLVAFVVTGNHVVSQQDICSELEGELPHYSIPQRVIAVNQIPRTERGKPDRSLLHQIANDNRSCSNER